MAELDPRTDRAGRAHKRVQWRAPTDVKKRPGVLNAARKRLVYGLEQRHGRLFQSISRAVIVAGYPRARELHRVRGLRSDACASLLALTVCLLYCTDVRSGFVGKPRAGGGPWHRYTLADLAQMAFGGQGEAEQRRAHRALRMMMSLGWAFQPRQIRDYAEETGKFIGLPAIRRLNLDTLCRALGIGWLLKRDRQHAERTKANNVAALHRDQHAGADADRQQAARARAAQRRTDQPAAGHQGQAPPATRSGPRAFGVIASTLDRKG